MVDEIRVATNGNFALVRILFKEQITAASGRRAMPAKNGRPKKQKASEEQWSVPNGTIVRHVINYLLIV